MSSPDPGKQTCLGTFYRWELPQYISIGYSRDNIEVRIGPAYDRRWKYLKLNQFNTKDEAIFVAGIWRDRLREELRQDGYDY